MPSEHSLERYFVARVTLFGGWAPKGESIATGFPDRIAFGPEGKIAFVELKAAGGVVSQIQKAMHRRLQRFGFAVEVIWTREGVNDFIKDFFDV